MDVRLLYGTVAALVSIAAAGCKAKPTAVEQSRATPSSSVTRLTPPALDHVIQSKDEVCNLLTSAEVSAQLKTPIQFARQRAIMPDAPTECIYPTDDGKDAGGVVVRLSFERPGSSGSSGFAHTVLEVCGHDAQKRVSALGDEAVQCGKLLVRKGESFFVLSLLRSEPAVPWDEVGPYLARKMVARLP